MPAKREVPVELCQKWLELRAREGTAVSVAETMRQEHPNYFGDIAVESINERCRRWSKRHGLSVPDRPRPEARLRYLEEVPELVFPYQDRLIVISDLHASAHDADIVDLALATIRDLEIKAAVLNGDQLDNSYLGHKGVRSRWAAPYDENISQFAEIADRLCEAGIEDFWVVQGNHDDKPMRGTDGELTYPQWWASAVAPTLAYPERFNVTHRYYCIMEPEHFAPWPYPQGWRNFPWRFTHQKEYSRTPLSVGKRLINAIGPTNIVCGHMHHLARGWHENGLLRVVDAGTFQHKDGASYKVNRDSTHPQWNQGFVTLVGNRPQLHEL